MKKGIAALLAVGLLCGLLGGCDEKPFRKPQVTLNVKCPALQMLCCADADVTTAAQFLQKAADAFCAGYEAADVTVKLVEFELTNEAEEIPGCFGTPDAADVLYEGYFNMSTYIHTGRVVPLDGIISPELREDIPQSYWDESTLEGKTYMMPFITSQNTMSFNVDLFRRAGLEEFIPEEDVMQSWAQPEWEYILETLRGQLPGLAYPMMMYAGNSQGDTHIMTLLRSFGCPLFDENGRFCVNTPEGIAALRWMKDCSDKGYFPAGADTLVILDNYNLFINGQLALYMNNAIQEDSCRQEGGFEVRSVNFPDFTAADGSGFATAFTTGFEVFDNGDEARLAVARDFVKFVYESDFIDYMAGAIPCSTRVAEKYGEELQGLRKYIDNSGANVNLTGNNPNWRGVRSAFYPNMQDLLFGDKTPEEVAANIDAACNAAIEEGRAGSVLHE